MTKHHVPHEMKIIGQNIRLMRENFGLSQKAIAEMMSVSFQQIQKYEHGKNRLPIEKLFMMKNIFGLPYEAFFEGLDPYTPHPNRFDTHIHLFKQLDNMKDEDLKKKIHSIMHILLN